jgi:hypothetical protein
MEDSRGYTSEIHTDYYWSRSVQNQYTREGLTLGEVYNISVRAKIRPLMGCYSSFYGEYSSSILVETVETGILA